MPYDPLAPQALRQTLRTLIHHFKLTRQHIRDAAIAHRRQRGLPPVIPFIDRSTLGRFIAGDDIRNIEALGASMIYSAKHDGPCLFIRGEKSNYYAAGDEALILNIFPRAEFITMNTGHWVQAENPEEFARVALTYLG